MSTKPSYAELEQRIHNLKKENQYNRVIAENAADITARLDQAGVCRQVSSGFSQLIGYRADELSGQHFCDFVHPDDQESITQSHKKILEKGIIDSVSCRVQHMRGHYLWVKSTGRAVRDSDTNKTKEIIVTMQGFTEGKQTEKEKQKLANQWQSTFDSVKDSICVLDADGTITQANKATARLLGLPLDRIIGKKCYELIHGNADPVSGRTVGRIEQTRNRETQTVRFGKGWLEITADPVFASNGSLQGVVHIMSDISERRTQDEALRQSEETLRSIFKAAPIGIGMVRNRTITQANERLCEMIGRSREDVVQQNARILYPSDVDYEYVGSEKYRQIKKEGSGTVETRWQHKSGAIRDILLSSTPVDPEDWSQGVTFTALDITDMKKMEESLRQAQKMESIGNLAGGIAHDFNNILFPIIGLSELLLHDLVPESLEYQNAEQILKAGKRGRDLVQQILAFSRQSEQRMIPVQVQQILKEVLKLSRSSIPADIDISHQIQEDCGLVMADPTQIHQLTMNLITNAYHAVEACGGSISVQLKEKYLKENELISDTLGPGHYAHLSVSDTGCGIDPDLIAKIFEPYFTTKEKSKGTGLGLSVVYGIAKEHGGDIFVQSELNQYTIFDVYLPLLDKTTERVAPGPTTDDVERGDERILLVDDEEPIAQLEKQALERYGYHVSARFSSLDALAAFKANPNGFDLVITDMTMPNMTGERLATEILKIRPDMPIIICTGFSARINEQKAKSMGIKGFLFKPVAGSQMANMVRNALDEAKGDK